MHCAEYIYPANNEPVREAGARVSGAGLQLSVTEAKAGKGRRRKKTDH